MQPHLQSDLHPYLTLEEAFRRREPVYAHAQNRSSSIGNGFLDLHLDFGEDGRLQSKVHNKVTGETMMPDFRPSRFWFDGEDEEPAMTFEHIEARGASSAAMISAVLRADWYDMEVIYVVQQGDPFIQKRVSIRNVQQPARLSRVSLFTHRLQEKYRPILHDCGMYCPVLFYRASKGGLFFCIDFPCYFASLDKGAFSFDYYPDHLLEPGRSFQSLTAHVGVYELSGRMRSNPFHESGAELDEGEIQWFRAYMHKSLVPTTLPHIEYEGTPEHKECTCYIDEIQQCAALGASHIILPRSTVDIAACPYREALHKSINHHGLSTTFRLIQKNAINLDTQVLFCTQELDERHVAYSSPPEWHIEKCLSYMERYGFSSVEMVGSPILPEHTQEDDDFIMESSRRKSLHKAFSNLVETVATLRESISHVASLGAYSCYGLGGARLFDCLSIMSEDYPLAIPDMHPGRLYADMRRLYFRRSYDYLVPKRQLRNTIGFPQVDIKGEQHPGAAVYPWYQYFDRVGWRYELLSAIATGLHHRFFSLPTGVNKDDIDFARKWLKWEEEHVQQLDETELLFGEPGLDTVDGYAYVGVHGAIVFLFNTSFDEVAVSFRLHLEHDTEYIARELYPREMNYLGPGEGLYTKDDVLSVTLSPKEAHVIEIVRRSPAASRRKRPEVFGAETSIHDHGVHIHGNPGQKYTLGIRTAEGFSKRDVVFPGKAFDPQIRKWSFIQHSLEEGIQTLTKGGFGGSDVADINTRLRNVWLTSKVSVPEGIQDKIDRTPFMLNRPCWTYQDRLFVFMRFEPEPWYEPIRTASEIDGYPESCLPHQIMRCGIDLAPLHIGLKAWVNGSSCRVYPAIAPWSRLDIHTSPHVAYWFEAGSQLHFDDSDVIVLFLRNLKPDLFKGAVFEHVPALKMELPLVIS